MSLYIYLELDPQEIDCTCSCGHEHKSKVSERVYEGNITHNLGKMADSAGIYQCMWRPDEIGITKAYQMIEILEKGLKDLSDNPLKYQKYSPENGWGTYEGLWNFVFKLLGACREYPNANVSVCR